MEKAKKRTTGDAVIQPLGELGMRFSCGGGGRIVAAHGIKFERLKTPPRVEQGKIIIVSSDAGEIKVKVGDVKPHVTELTTTANKGNDQKLLIRIPIGVRLFELTEAPKGFERAFFFEAGDGYNVLPYLLAAGRDEDQPVQELILITSHVPPRPDLTKIGPADVDENFIARKLDAKALETRLKQDGLSL